MKKALSLFLLITIIITLVPACSAASPYTEGEGELNIVASSFVPFDFARAVTGEKAKLTVLQTSGGDLHDYTPTASALKALAEADIFICIGGLSDDKWVDAALKASENTDARVIRLSELVNGELAELEGHSHSTFCEQNHSHSHGAHDHIHEPDDGHGHVADEHVWTSPKNAIKAINAIATACAEKDSANASRYGENAAAYLEKLTALDAKYTEAFNSSTHRTLIFADRFPFIYLTHDYSACYHAAFSGCSSEISASFETVVRLTNAAKHNSAHYVIITESSDGELARSISDATGCGILTLNSLQSVSLTEIRMGITYLDTMESNLKVLQKALA